MYLKSKPMDLQRIEGRGRYSSLVCKINLCHLIIFITEFFILLYRHVLYGQSSIIAKLKYTAVKLEK